MLTPIATMITSPTLQWMVNLLLESTLILIPVAALVAFGRHYLSSTAAHLLCFAGLIAVALLPISGAITAWFTDTSIGAGYITVFTVTAGIPGTEASKASDLSLLLPVLYGLVALLLLTRLIKSWLNLARLDQNATLCQDPERRELLGELVREQGIGRTVQLKLSNTLNSPVSYGLLRPRILLPSNAVNWPCDTHRQILIHELSHIRRLDWLIMLAARIICSLFWLNPLAWLTLRQLNEQAEQSCDAEVYRSGGDPLVYAENLLQLARQQLSGGRSPLLAQSMYGRQSLDKRIRSIVEGRLPARSNKIMKTALALGLLVTTTGFNSVTLVSAQNRPVDQEYAPIQVRNPSYPTRAAEDGVEGWTLYRFTVTAEGTVDPGSIEVVDAAPSGYFEHTSESALKGFRFQPRIIGGQAVAVEGVEYLFRYELENDGEPDFERQPPPPGQ